MLLQAGGLARLAGTGLELTPRGEAVLARPSYQALSELWGRWLKSVSHDELSRIEAIRGQRKPGTLTTAARRRAAVAEGLAAVEPGIWIDVDTLFAIVRAQPAPLAVARSPLAQWRLYLVDSHYGSLGPAGATAWNALEGRYALCVLFESAATLGVIDVAYTGPRGARDDYRGAVGRRPLRLLVPLRRPGRRAGQRPGRRDPARSRRPGRPVPPGAQAGTD